MSKLIPAVVICFLTALSTPLSAQWFKTGGPPGGGFHEAVFTGEACIATSSDGLYKSSDQGLSWQKNANFTRTSFTDLAAHKAFVLVRGIHDSLGRVEYVSQDAGLTWQPVVLPSPDSVQSNFLVFNGCIYALKYNVGTIRSCDLGATWEFVSSEPYGFHADGDVLYRSENKTIKVSFDEGFTWQTLMTFPNAVGLYYINGSTAIIKNGVLSNSVSYTENLGITWKTIPVAASTLNNFDVMLPFKGKIYAFEQIHSRVWKADTSATVFTEVNLQEGTATAFSVFSNGQELVRTTVYGGILHSADGQQWQRSEGVEAGYINELKIYDDNLYAATTAGLFRMEPDKYHWSTAAPFYDLLDVRDVVVLHDTVVVSAWAGRVYVSTDNGQTFQWAINASDSSNIWSMGRLEKIGPILVGWDPYPSGDYQKYSDDNGFTWKHLPGVPPTGVMGTYDGQFYLLEFGTSQLKRLNTATLLFEPIGSPLPLSQSFLLFEESPLAISGDLWVVGMSASTTIGYTYFVSTDAGTSWQEYGPVVTNGIYSDYKVESIQIVNDTIFFMLPSNGVYFSADYGNTWQSWNEKLDCRSIYASTLFQGELVVGGSGVYRRNANGSQPTIPVREPEPVALLTVSPNPASEAVQVQLPSEALPGLLRVVDANGRTVMQQQAADETEKIRVAQLPAGHYFLLFYGKNNTSMRGSFSH